ncbi:MAG TPA: heme exporter protein CcmD [Gammaproteobacteria bacterium]
MSPASDYTFYIVASYGISFIVLVAAIIRPLWQHRHIVRELRNLQRRQAQLEKRRQ